MKFIIFLALLPLLFKSSDAEELDYTEKLRRSSVLIVTKSSVQFRPLSTEGKTIFLKKPWNGEVVDCDYDQKLDRVVILSNNSPHGNRLDVVRLPTPDQQELTAEVYRAMNESSPEHGNFYVDNVRIVLSEDVSWKKTTFFMWDSPAPEATELHLQKVVCERSNDNKKPAYCHHGSSKMLENQRNFSAPRENMWLRKNFDRVSINNVEKEVWVADVAQESSKLTLSRLDESDDSEYTFSVIMPGYQIGRVLRLSVENGMACVAFEENRSKLRAVAVVPVEYPIPTQTAQIFVAKDLVGAYLLFGVSTAQLLKASPSLFFDLTDLPSLASASSSSSSNDQTDIALIVLGFFSILTALILSIGAAYYLYLQRRFQGFRRLGQVWFQYRRIKVGDDDRLLLKHEDEYDDVDKGNRSDDPLLASAPCLAPRQPSDASRPNLTAGHLDAV